MKQIERKPLTTAVTLAGVILAVLVAVYVLGEFALGRMLKEDALATAELWSRALGQQNDLETALAGANPEALDSTLRIADIDRLLLVPAAQNPIAFRGQTGAAELVGVTGAAKGALYKLDSGVYTDDSISWMSPTPFRSWVVFPPRREAGARLALRVDQSATAAELVSSFEHEVLFSGGVAIITFVSFMAGFSYRQRQL